MKKCFTINPFRKTDDFKSYEELFLNNIYQAIEIFYPYNLTIEEKETYKKNVENIKKKYPHIEVVMHLPHGPSSNLCDFTNYQEIVKRMKDGMDFTSIYDTKKLTLHLGQINKEYSRKKHIEHIILVLKDLCEYAKQYQMNIMIENMPASNELGYSPEEIKEIIDKVNYNNLMFILDTGHAHVSSYSNEEYIDVLKDKLIHMHFSDNDGTRDMHQRIGTGTINFKSIFEKLKEVNYNGLLCLEILFNSSEDLKKYALDLDNCKK